jgi:hypothetical protein
MRSGAGASISAALYNCDFEQLISVEDNIFDNFSYTCCGKGVRRRG